MPKTNGSLSPSLSPPAASAALKLPLVCTVLLIGLLNYVPALALGPVVEHFMLWSK